MRVQVLRANESYSGGLIFVKEGTPYESSLSTELLGIFDLPEEFLNKLIHRDFDEPGIWYEAYYE